MSSDAASTDTGQSGAGKATRRSIAGRLIAKKLSSFERGQITFVLPNGATVVHTGTQDGARAHIRILRWRALLRLLSEGDVGLATAYIEGEWTTDDIAAVMAFGMDNNRNLAHALDGSRLWHNMNRLRHGLRRNTRRGSKRNIAAHYDLGNAFYREWLDGGMQYSSALYESPGDSLEKAQGRKLDRIGELLDLSGGETVLEIGCGWGAVAERLASRYGCNVTGITLSREQAEFARRRLAAAGLAGKTAIELRDYRDVDNRFDRIVSIEMFEAVGTEYWPLYFEKLAGSLEQRGNAVLQIITIAEEYFEYYRRRPDFIQKYIFPGGMLPTKSHLHDLAENAGLKIMHQECFAGSYRRTLDTWRRRFDSRWAAIAPLGFDERFRRMWNWYLEYCATGFAYGTIDVGLYKLTRR